MSDRRKAHLIIVNEVRRTMFEAKSTDDQAKCKFCDAPIVWITTEKGNKMPLDVRPEFSIQWRISIGAVGVKGGADDVYRYFCDAHQAHCPNYKPKKKGG